MNFNRIAPALFVLMWSSGWIAPVFGSRHSTAEMFLCVRFALAAVAFALLSLVLRARWPRELKEIGHALISGMLMHGCYLGGVWWAIFNGVPASVSGVIAALQPLMTAALAPWLIKERLSHLQFLGLMLGFVGILLALVPSFEGMEAGQLSQKLWPIIVNVIAMSGVVLGTLYQKRFVVAGDMRTTAVFQYFGALLIVGPLALTVEAPHFDWSLELGLTMAWSVIVLSMGGVGLLLYMIRRGQVSRAASLVYLMPPTVAIESWLFLDEPLGPWMIAGTVIVVFGVWLAGRKPSNSAA